MSHILDLLSYARNESQQHVWLGFEGTISDYDPSTGSATMVEGEGYSNFGDEPDQTPFPIVGPLFTTQVGDGHGPVGGERAVAIPSRNGWRILLITDSDDAPGVPVGERWILHRNPQTLAWDSGMKLTVDGPTTGDGLGGAYFGNEGALTQTQTKSGFKDTLNDTAQTATRVTPGGMHDEFDDVSKQITRLVSSSTFQLLDGVAQKITHQAQSAFSIIDGVNNEINHVAAGIGLGATFGSLSSTLSAMRNADISTFENALHSQRLSDLENLATAVAGALATASPPVTISASAIIALIASLAHISVPSGSSVTRIL